MTAQEFYIEQRERSLRLLTNARIDPDMAFEVAHDIALKKMGSRPVEPQDADDFENSPNVYGA